MSSATCATCAKPFEQRHPRNTKCGRCHRLARDAAYREQGYLLGYAEGYAAGISDGPADPPDPRPPLATEAEEAQLERARRVLEGEIAS